MIQQPEESINSEFDLKSNRSELSFDDAYRRMRSLTTLVTDNEDEEYERRRDPVKGFTLYTIYTVTLAL